MFSGTCWSNSSYSSCCIHPLRRPGRRYPVGWSRYSAPRRRGRQQGLTNSPSPTKSFVLLGGQDNLSGRSLRSTSSATHSRWAHRRTACTGLRRVETPLPYSGIGGVGYDADLPARESTRPTFSDLDVLFKAAGRRRRRGSGCSMRFSIRPAGRWLFRASRVPVPPPLPRPSTAPRGPATSPATRRRLVGGVVFGKKSYIYKSLVADARAPKAKGPVAARLVGLDRNGHEVAGVPIRGKPHVPFREAPPFLVSLPASDRIVALELRSASRRKVLDKLKASDSTPKGGFLRLRRHARAGKPFAVRWRATDADNNSLTVTLLARRGGAWQPLATGPAAFHARFRPLDPRKR